MAQSDNFFERFTVDPALFYSAIIRSTDDYVYIVDMKTDMALVSPNMERDFELPGRQFEGLVPMWGGLVHEKDRARYIESIDEMLRGGTDIHHVEYQVRNRKGEYVWVLCRGVLQKDDQNQPAMFAGVVTDLGKMGKIDYTTGLFTYRECEKEISALLDQQTENPGGLILLGLDDFVRINDLNSHLFGDGVLRQFAQTVQQLLPEEASMYRFDGDEFAVVCPGAGVEELEEIYKRLHVYSNRVHTLDGQEYFCTVSAGMTLLGQDSQNYPDLIKCASSALEASKNKGKNTMTAYAPTLMRSKLRALELTSRLQLSVVNGMEGFRLVYQPFANSKDLGLAGAEALLRWSGTPFGEVTPVEFIPLLESSGLIVPVGKWVLEQAIRTCKKWSAIEPDFIMNVNISYLQMLDESFAEHVERTLAENELDSRHIVLELTESCFVTDMGGLKEIFKHLRGMRIQIAMDDFGTGYSSLGMLSQSPADIVKIDRLFIEAIDRDENVFNRSFIASVIKLCHSVGITVCVEGVEEQDELRAVCDLEVDSIQGYYISKPISPADFEQKYWDKN
nr:GGDEF and EAL domain-containing protein [Eubacterium sp. 1001713B170207_170306_E7]